MRYNLFADAKAFEDRTKDLVTRNFTSCDSGKVMETFPQILSYQVCRYLEIIIALGVRGSQALDYTQKAFLSTGKRFIVPQITDYRLILR